MTIRLYPSLMPGEPIETHEWAGTVAGWFAHKGIDYTTYENQPVVVSINGVDLPVDLWPERRLHADDDVEMRLLPHGGGFSKVLGIITGTFFDVVFGWLMPRGRGGSDYNAPGQGQKLETSQAKANTAKLGEVVPELAGRFKRLPDYLTPPHRYFKSEREQWLEFHACIGPGHYDIQPEDVRVGNTTFDSLGEDGSYALYGPGADLSAVSTNEHWYTADEVGGTSSGTAGLELSVDPAAKDFAGATSYVFDNDTVVLPEEAGEFPEGWGAGTVVKIAVPRTYDVTLENLGGPFPFEDIFINKFDGDFRHAMPFDVGDALDVSGAGLAAQAYKVHSMSVNATTGQGWVRLETFETPGPGFEDPPTPGAPVMDADTGSKSMRFTRADSSFRVVTAQVDTLAVQRLLNGSVDNDWLGFSSFTTGSASSIAYLSGLVYGEWTSIIGACPPGETTNTIEVDFFFASGLGKIKDDGDLEAYSVTVEIQYKDATAEEPFISVMKAYSAATLDQIGYTETINVDGRTPIVRVRRATLASTSTQVQDKINWFGLKSKLKTRNSYPNWTTMAVKFRSGGRLAAQSENQVNVVATRRLRTLQPDGSWSAALEPTRDISAFAKYVTDTIGYTDDDWNIAELLRLHNVWVPRGETFDFVFDQTTVKEVMNTVLNAGMAELTVDDGLIRPVRDEPRTVFEQSYSPQNMTKPLSRQFVGPKPDDADGVEMEYIDGQTWTKQTVRCLLPGDQGFKLKKERLDGVTDKTRVWRIGMRLRRQLRYRRWAYNFATEMDALNSRYRSYVALFDDIPGYGKSAILERIEAVSGGALLHASEPFEWEPGVDHVVAYRATNGSLVGPFAASPGVDDCSLIADIPHPWPIVTLTMEPPHLYFGTAERWSFPALITDIKPQGIGAVSVTAENDDVRVYADDNNNPPI
ncbi:host specificity factor TipJ family phage tail protein [Pusillimonas sp. ANT_WB101]|uniref:host specificity factor TipJ family phage tail protein n=1 Tax=Pusillimonas sp. ANT_WB101 TaxID=2597356 RepID=UPI0011EDD276|nr:host specificity factor TipJ family phage tail protein [Pusillimonas sp. ANT_WB101]KAA0910691.1 hypothetical protein FQ179_02100 [Pusillimonas sp. ANT_WB101]